MTERDFRFGIVTGRAPSGAEWSAVARRAEDLGFDTLLVPDTGGKGLDWTLDEAVKSIRTAARGPERLRPAHVDGIEGGTDPFEAVRRALEQGDFHDVVISTLPKRRSEWLKKALPERVEALGVPVKVITPPEPSRDRVMSFLLPDRPDGRD